MNHKKKIKKLENKNNSYKEFEKIEVGLQAQSIQLNGSFLPLLEIHRCERWITSPPRVSILGLVELKVALLRKSHRTHIETWTTALKILLSLPRGKTLSERLRISYTFEKWNWPRFHHIVIDQDSTTASESNHNVILLRIFISC